jgi:hypothetical protein
MCDLVANVAADKNASWEIAVIVYRSRQFVVKDFFFVGLFVMMR